VGSVHLWFRLLQLGAVVGVALVLAAPATRRIALTFAATPSAQVRDADRRAAEFARRHGAEPGWKIAAAVASVPGGVAAAREDPRIAAAIADKLHRLTEAFPRSAAVRAAAIRAQCDLLGVSGRLGQALMGTTEYGTPSHDERTRWRTSAQRILEDSEAGAVADPTNAFFPAMRSFALFVLDRKAEALAALHDASGKSEWRDYVPEQIRGAWQLREEVGGSWPLYGMIADTTSVSTGHFRMLRVLGQAATHHAMEREVAGRPAEGVGIRADAMRLGSLIRAEASMLIGTMTGLAMSRGALTRPGGAPLLRAPADERWSQDRWDREIIGQYVAYLEKHGLHKDVAHVRAEAALWPAARRAANFGDWLMPEWVRSILWGALIGYLLATVVWLAGLRALAGSGERSARSPSFRGVLLLLWLGLGLAFVLPGSAMLAWLTLGRTFRGMGGLAVLSHEMAPGYSGWFSAFGLSSVVLMTGLLFVALVRAIRSRGGSDGATAWYRTAAGTLLLVYALLWAGSVAVAARVERSSAQVLAEATSHEGRFLARRRHVPWPGMPTHPMVTSRQR